MGLKDDLAAEVRAIFAARWDVEKTQNVPEPENLRLNANHAKELDSATVLYADLDGSTKMVDIYKWAFCAEVYKAFLRCAAGVIRSESGVITAYDGDRIMAVFTGDSKNTSAVRCALKINWAVKNIVQPALLAQYPTTDFTLSHVVGVDTSELHPARIGVRGDNDIVWVGRAANYAAKLTTLNNKATWITNAVYDSMNETARVTSGQNMWTAHDWTAMNDMRIYASTWWWRFP